MPRKKGLERFPDLLESQAVDSRIGDLMKYLEVGFTVIQFFFNGCPKGKRHSPVILLSHDRGKKVYPSPIPLRFMLVAVTDRV